MPPSQSAETAGRGSPCAPSHPSPTSLGAARWRRDREAASSRRAVLTEPAPDSAGPSPHCPPRAPGSFWRPRCRRLLAGLVYPNRFRTFCRAAASWCWTSHWFHLFVAFGGPGCHGKAGCHGILDTRIPQKRTPEVLHHQLGCPGAGLEGLAGGW